MFINYRIFIFLRLRSKSLPIFFYKRHKITPRLVRPSKNIPEKRIAGTRNKEEREREQMMINVCCEYARGKSNVDCGAMNHEEEETTTLDACSGSKARWG